MGSSMDYEDRIRELLVTTGAVAGAVISRDGRVVAAVVPDHVSRETFSIMCATIMGASVTAFTELGRLSPNRLVIASPDAQLLVLPLDKKHLVALVLTASADLVAAEITADEFLGLTPVP